jgi:hypothetical protein
MVKRIMIMILLFAFCVDSKSQNKDYLDSLLVYMDKLIRNDISNDSIYILERQWIGFGEVFILEVVFDAKNIGILTMLRASESMTKKYYKQPFQVRLRLSPFRRYINEHHTFPYNTFEYFNYRFLLFAKKGESFGDAIYGEYKFKATEKGISIMDKKIEVLQGENAIIQKYNSNF